MVKYGCSLECIGLQGRPSRRPHSRMAIDQTRRPSGGSAGVPPTAQGALARSQECTVGLWAQEPSPGRLGAALQPRSPAAPQPRSPAAPQPRSPAALQPLRRATASHIRLQPPSPVVAGVSPVLSPNIARPAAAGAGANDWGSGSGRGSGNGRGRGSGSGGGDSSGGGGVALPSSTRTAAQVQQQRLQQMRNSHRP